MKFGREMFGFGREKPKEIPDKLEVHWIEKERIKEDIEELREPIQKILEQIRPDIENEKYQLIIGDDSSGRVPALIMNDVIRRRYQANGSEIANVFIAGSRGIKEGDVENKINNIKTLLETLEKRNGKIKHALVVTEAIKTGEGMKPLAMALKEAGIGVE